MLKYSVLCKGDVKIPSPVTQTMLKYRVLCKDDVKIFSPVHRRC